MNKSVTFQDLVSHFGSQAAMARALGISKSAVSEWKGVVPESRAWQIQVLTDGLFKADEILAGREHKAA